MRGQAAAVSGEGDRRPASAGGREAVSQEMVVDKEAETEAPSAVKSAQRLLFDSCRTVYLHCHRQSFLLRD